MGRFLISFINDPAVSDRGAQILLVSHNTTLMDLDMMRRDEIWLMELDDQHASALSTVLRSSPRRHKQIAEGFLRGRYGAVPSIQAAELLGLADGENLKPVTRARVKLVT